MADLEKRIVHRMRRLCLSGAAVRNVFLTVPPTSQIRSDVWVATKISIARNICIFYHNSDKTWVTAW